MIKATHDPHSPAATEYAVGKLSLMVIRYESGTKTYHLWYGMKRLARWARRSKNV